MKVLVVGGGTGGHVMPAMVVVKELKRISVRSQVEFWTDRKNVGTVKKLAEDEDVKIRIKSVSAGKFRRYAGWKLKDYFIRIDLTLKDLIGKNIISLFRFLFGFLQSLIRLLPKKNRPDVIFLKGGYVGLPVGLVAGIMKIPYVIHESDAAVGLANRLLAKNAKYIAMGVPCEEDGKKVFVGVPISDNYRSVGAKKQRELKEALGFDPDRLLVMVTGGSQGAQTLNEAVRHEVGRWIKVCNVGLITGKKHYAEMEGLKELEKTGNFRMWDFSFAIDELLGAADIVISRAGATTIAELAALNKAVILVPFERLPGSHQVVNAKKMAESGAVQYILNDEVYNHPEKLTEMLMSLVGNSEKRDEMRKQLSTMRGKDAAKKIAEMIFEVYYDTKR